MFLIRPFILKGLKIFGIVTNYRRVYVGCGDAELRRTREREKLNEVDDNCVFERG